MLTFYLWAIPIGQLAFAGNYHWFATMLLSLSSLAVMFTKWVIWVTYTVLTVLYITDMHSLSLIRVYSIAISNMQYLRSVVAAYTGSRFVCVGSRVLSADSIRAEYINKIGKKDMVL